MNDELIQFLAEYVRDKITTAKIDLYSDPKSKIRRAIAEAIRAGMARWPEYQQECAERNRR